MCCALGWKFDKNFQPNLTVYTVLELVLFLSWYKWDLLHLQESRNFNVAAIVEAIRSDLKFPADLESMACRVSKIVQPCG